MRAPPRFRPITPGFERLAAGYALPRHAHFAAHVPVVLTGATPRTWRRAIQGPDRTKSS